MFDFFKELFATNQFFTGTAISGLLLGIIYKLQGVLYWSYYRIRQLKYLIQQYEITIDYINSKKLKYERKILDPANRDIIDKLDLALLEYKNKEAELRRKTKKFKEELDSYFLIN